RIPAAREINLTSISDYDSGKDSPDLSSPTSVLRFSPPEKAERRLHNQSIMPEGGDWIPTEPVIASFSDDCLPLDPCYLNEFFDFRSPSPIMYEEVSLPETALEGDFCDVSSVNLDEDFRSCSWDVDDFFEDPLLLV
ncbi:hypothetical protein U1Q18_023640, partial [Sarracenia purpurea var. burkii]